MRSRLMQLPGRTDWARPRSGPAYLFQSVVNDAERDAESFSLQSTRPCRQLVRPYTKQPDWSILTSLFRPSLARLHAVSVRSDGPSDLRYKSLIRVSVHRKRRNGENSILTLGSQKSQQNGNKKPSCR